MHIRTGAIVLAAMALIGANIAAAATGGSDASSDSKSATMKTGTDGNTTTPGSNRGAPNASSATGPGATSGGGVKTGTDGNTTSPGSNRGAPGAKSSSN